MYDVTLELFAISTELLLPFLPTVGPPWVAIVLGSVLGVVFLILTIILIFHIVRTVRKKRVRHESPDGSEAGLPNYRMCHPDRRFWQARGDTMHEPRETPLQDAYNHQRMNVISKAMGRFSNIVSNSCSGCTILLASW